MASWISVHLCEGVYMYLNQRKKCLCVCVCMSVFVLYVYWCDFSFTMQTGRSVRPNQVRLGEEL